MSGCDTAEPARESALASWYGRCGPSIAGPAAKNHARHVDGYLAWRIRWRPDVPAQPGSVHEQDLPVLAHHDRSVAHAEGTLAELPDRSCPVQCPGELVKVGERLGPAGKLLHGEHHGPLAVPVGAGIQTVGPGRGRHRCLGSHYLGNLPGCLRGTDHAGN